ncbi:TPA: class I SAM-dependent methyltransferase [Candidatus Woesearchaeota archaeon]|nr:class I SAM-dependent methyltransferase [Candidatus Woesearchaeota archaeon]
MAESTVQHWDALWEQHKNEPVHDRQLLRIIELYRSMRGSLKGKRVLETGAGSGVDSITLAKMTGCKPHCVDYSKRSIAFLRKNFKAAKVTGHFIHADMRKMPIKDRTFDVVFSNGVLEHFKTENERIAIVKEQSRVLRPGGLLVIGVPETYSLYTIKKQIAIRRGTWFAGWETQFSKRELRALATKAKLKVVECRVYGNAPLSFPPLLQRITTMLHINRWLASDVVVYCTK